jgi:hypothetical protein
MNLVTPQAAAKRELLFNKPASVIAALLLLFVLPMTDAGWLNKSSSLAAPLSVTNYDDYECTLLSSLTYSREY